MFGWEFPPYNSGGLGVACWGLTKALTEYEGVDITFVLPKRLDIKVKYMKFAFADVHIKFKHIDTLLTPYITSQMYDQKLGKNLRRLYGKDLISEVNRYAEMAKEIAREEEFDIVHAHDWLAFGAGINAAEVSGKPVILHVHSTEFDRTGGQGANEEVYEIERTSLAKADKVIAVSEFTKQGIVDHYGIAPDKIAVVHNGIESYPEQYEDTANDQVGNGLEELRKAGKKLVLFLGRFTVQKGADIFINVAAKVLKYRPDTVFLMVGAGELENQLIQHVAALGISDKVVFTGFLRGANKDKVYKAADLFVMPSVSEPFGLVALESLVNGTPIIISNQSGVSEVIRNALKVDFWDVDEMTNQIVTALEYDSMRDDLTSQGRGEAFNVTWQRAAARCAKIYTDLIQAQSGKHKIAKSRK